MNARGGAVDSRLVPDLLREYCQAVRQIVADTDHSPEESLYPALYDLLSSLLPGLVGRDDLRVIQQAQAQVGAPDFKVSITQRPPLGFIEAKAIDNDLRARAGHDREQFRRYCDLPNWVYTNFWQVHLYARGELIERAELVPRGALDTVDDLDEQLSAHDATRAIELLQRFATSVPPPMTDAAAVASWLASSARLVRHSVRAALALPESEVRPLIDVREEFRDVLFAEMAEDDEEDGNYDAIFADAFAQTLAYGLLIARVESGQQIDLGNVHQLIDAAHHPLLRATVRLLAEDEIRNVVGWSLEVLSDLVNGVDQGVLEGGDGRDAILYFYEDFLAAYDPDLREKRGVYYTPASVVRFQVSMVHRLLKERFGLPDGLLNERVHVLDPAIGTGTYLVACVQEAAAEAAAQWGPGSVARAVQQVLNRLYGFELLVGPYTVAHYRLHATARSLGAEIQGRLRVYLTDTLSRSHETTGFAPRFAYLSQPLTEERRQADDVKARAPILVVLGNPPYDRTTALRNQWIYRELLDDFRRPVQQAQLGVHLKSLSDPYVYFYRWALWRLFEAEGAVGQGVLTFITNRSWLRGEAFGGMRKAVRERFDEGWIVDLHGDSRAPRPAGIAIDENVFDIQAGVAIGIFSRTSAEFEQASIRYTSVFGDRGAKEGLLREGREAFAWLDVRGTGIDQLLPAMGAECESWPVLTELFAFSRSGVKTERDNLAVCVDRDELIRRLEAFYRLPIDERRERFHESGGRTVARIRHQRVQEEFMRKVCYRFLDERYLYNDPDFVSRPGPRLQAVWGDDNVGLYALPARTGYGQAAVAVGLLPDYHVFRGSYGGYLFPLYDRRLTDGGLVDPEGGSNITPAVLASLREHFGERVAPEDVFHYIYGVLACQQYSLRFSDELQRGFPRVPISRDAQLFDRVCSMGESLVRLHTLTEAGRGAGAAQIHGNPREVSAPRFDGEKVYVGEECWVEPVSEAAWGYSISGYPVFRRWIEGRAGMELTLELIRQLLDVVHTLERTVVLQDELADLVEAVVAGETFPATDLGLRR